MTDIILLLSEIKFWVLVIINQLSIIIIIIN